MAPPHLPAPTPLPLQYRCSQCQKLVTMDSNNPKAIASPFLCNVCQYSPSSAIFPQSQTLPPSQVNATPPSHGAGPSPHSGYRPPAGISPAIPAPPMSPIHPKRSNLVRKALLIGINYHGQSGELRGCCNDVKEMYKLLTKIYGWDSSHFRILTDESLHLPNQLSSSHPRDSKPNKRNILDGMRWLSADVLPGDALFFHYSGHGAQQPDPNGIESDGMNETILPVDYQSEGMITDDQINSVLIQTLPDGVRLTCIMDSCHSGTGIVV
jgi:metacaspase-1